jgi:hypothetical protein
MATITKGKTFTNGELVTPQKLHELVDLGSVANIVNADISAAAAIADTKLAQITTAGKVANSATTATNASTANAIVARDGSGNFSAGTITANLTGNASTATTATTAAACSGNAATATTLQTARTINGVSFNGSANITVTATPDAHTHDDRYYTESEMNTLLAGKQASGSYAPATGIAPSAITGTAVITTDSRLSDARTPTTHTHDDRYYTETEVNSLLAGKQASGSYAAATHTHSADDITSGTLANARTTATSANTASAIVARDASGNFSAGVITASGLSGNSVISRTLATEVSATSQINYNNYSGQFLSKVPKCDAADAQLHVPGIKCFGISNFSSGGNSGICSVFAVSASGTTLVETGIGGILTNSTNNGVIYSTSSDYRLKTDLEKLTSALDRLSALPVHRFKWVGHPTAPKVDGFLAHEAQAVVPEAVTGTKDAVDSDGKPIYQGIDQSKLVPLLVAAVQELAARVEALEAK